MKVTIKKKFSNLLMKGEHLKLSNQLKYFENFHVYSVNSSVNNMKSLKYLEKFLNYTTKEKTRVLSNSKKNQNSNLFLNFVIFYERILANLK